MNDSAPSPADPAPPPPVQARLAGIADKLEAILESRVDEMSNAPEPPAITEINIAAQALWRLTAVRKTLLSFTAPAPEGNDPRPEPRGITEEEIQELLDRHSGYEHDDEEPNGGDFQFLPGDLSSRRPIPTPPSEPPRLCVRSISIPACPTIPTLRPQSIANLIRRFPAPPAPPAPVSPSSSYPRSSAFIGGSNSALSSPLTFPSCRICDPVEFSSPPSAAARGQPPGPAP